MKAIRGQVVQHAAIRVLSAALSFGLFTLITSKLPVEPSCRVIFYLFALGFGIATMRLFFQVAAGLHPVQRRTEKILSLWKGLRITVLVTLVVSPLAGWVLWQHTQQGWIVALSLVVSFLAIPDVDLARSIVRRNMLFPTLFTVGTVMALVGVLVCPRLGLTEACGCLLLQWVPAGLSNLMVMRRWIHKILFNRYGVTPWTMLTMFLVAVLDGVVLNGPYLGFIKPGNAAASDLALTTRVLVASLPMLPLLTHWLNQGMLEKGLLPHGLSMTTGFAGILGISGLLIGMVYGLFFVYFSSWVLSVHVFVLFLMLLLAYCIFAAVTRIHVPHLNTPRRLWFTLLPLLIYLGVMGIAGTVLMDSATWIVALQAVTLLLASWLGLKR